MHIQHPRQKATKREAPQQKHGQHAARLAPSVPDRTYRKKYGQHTPLLLTPAGGSRDARPKSGRWVGPFVTLVQKKNGPNETAKKKKKTKELLCRVRMMTIERFDYFIAHRRKLLLRHLFPKTCLLDRLS